MLFRFCRTFRHISPHFATYFFPHMPFYPVVPFIILVIILDAIEDARDTLNRVMLPATCSG